VVTIAEINAMNNVLFIAWNLVKNIIHVVIFGINIVMKNGLNLAPNLVGKYYHVDIDVKINVI
jgi:hypothetical protein